MRAALVLAIVLLAPAANAALVLDAEVQGMDATAFIAVVEESPNQPKTHQNMAVTLTQGNRTWFTSDTLHEHDGIGVFSVGLDGKYQVTVEADDQIRTAPSEGHWSYGNDSRWPTEIRGDGFTISQPVGTLAEWIVRGEQGVWLRGWTRVVFQDETPIEVFAIDDDVDVEFRVYGQPHFATYRGAWPEPEVKPATEDPWTPCTPGQVRLDPEEVHLGNPIRVTLGDSMEPAFFEPTFQLVRDVNALDDGELPADALQQEVYMAWYSDGPGAASSFRIPFPGIFRLQVEGREDRCELVINTADQANRVITEVDGQESFFGMENGSLVFRTDVPGNGHYEHPAMVSYAHGNTGFMIWSGKLHSHGGPVEFRIPDPAPGTYTVRWDTGAQGPDPIVPEAQERMFTVEAMDEDIVDTPAPLGITVVVAVALLVRRFRLP